MQKLGAPILKHTCREQNKVTDALARSENGDIFFDQFQTLTFLPMRVAETLATDNLGNAFHWKVVICNINSYIHVLTQNHMRGLLEPIFMLAHAPS